MDADFQKAADEAKKFTKKPTDKELLELYSLYKQATAGDCNTDRPGILDLKGKAKWDAWNERKGTTQEKAKEEYISVVERLKGEYK